MEAAVTIPEWQIVAGVPPLDKRRIHVWLLEIDKAEPSTVEGVLSRPELERAAAFRFPIHRDEFVIARGALRFLLGRYLEISPGDVEIEYAQNGKPYLRAAADRNIQFNLSHSGNYAVFAFSNAVELGIDIERHQSHVIDEGLLKQCLTDAENERYRIAPNDCKVQSFFDTWARKEAYMKLKGEGMSIPPNEFELSSPATLRDTIRGEETRFTILPHINGYSAALATMRKAGRIEFYTLGSNLLR